MWHMLLLKWDMMLGVDVHFEIDAIIPPKPEPFVPHVVGMAIQGLTPLGPKLTGDNVVANGKHIVYKGSDISFLIPHIPVVPWPPMVLAPVIMTVLSGSKTYFGPSSVVGKVGPIACALIPPDTNIQLNCGFPCPTPTGLVQAMTTVVCGMTWGDIIGGLVAMVVDAAVQTVENLLCWKLGKVIGPIGKTKAGKAIVEAVVGAVVQQVTGSPIGYTAGVATGGQDSKWNPGNWGGNLGDAVGGAIDRATGAAPSPSTPANTTATSTATHSVTNDPGVEQH
jgi:hypothetical protein